MGFIGIKYGFRFSCDMAGCLNTKDIAETDIFPTAWRLLETKKWLLLRLRKTDGLRHICPKCGRRIAKKYQTKDES